MVAIVLRVGWMLAGEVRLDTDFLVYDQIAMGILRRELWIEPWTAAGAPIIFAAHYFLFGHDTLWPLLSIVAVSSLQVLLVFDILKTETGNRTIANIGAILLTVWPEHLLYVNLLGTDVLY